MKYLHPGVTCVTHLTLVFAVSGCVSTTPYLDQHFGEAVNLIKAQQILHPDAGTNTNPVAGIDGIAAKSAMDQYQKSFSAPEPQQNVFKIGVGGR